MATQEDTNQGELLEQQRVLAEFGDFALKTEAIDAILTRACELISRALETDLAKSRTAEERDSTHVSALMLLLLPS